MDVFDKMKLRWKSAVVARSKIGEFTGGLLSPQTCANLDCLGEGIQGSVKVGNRILYDVDEVIEFLKKRANMNEEVAA